MNDKTGWIEVTGLIQKAGWVSTEGNGVSKSGWLSDGSEGF